MIDYSYLYKDCISVESIPNVEWDLFLSSYNKSERVSRVCDAVQAKLKVVIAHNEYMIPPEEIPDGAFTTAASDEDEFIFQLFESRVGSISLDNAKICVDITGFLRPHLLFLLRLLMVHGARKITALYAEPGQYSQLDDTSFGSGEVHSVRQIRGFEGLTASSSRKDFMIIGAGFEDRLIAEVAEDKDLARKILMLGLPSLKADMYQHSVVRTRRARDALGEGVGEIFAPASDPFATASMLSSLVERERETREIASLYLSPISTKPSALGFCLFYLRECMNTPTSIIFPFSRSYSTEASEGIGRVWMYDVEFE